MTCPVCHGLRFVEKPLPNLAVNAPSCYVITMAHEPCPECGGQGQVQCCDGMALQADPFLTVEGEQA